FSPDATRVATADFKALVRIWDAASGEELLTLKGHSSWVWSLAFSPDGKRLYSGSRDRTVRVWRADPPAAAPMPEAPGLSLDPARGWPRRGSTRGRSPWGEGSDLTRPGGCGAGSSTSAASDGSTTSWRPSPHRASSASV